MSGVVKGIYLQVAGSGVCFPSEKTGCAESVRTQTRKASCVTGESRSDSGVGVGSQCAACTCMLGGRLRLGIDWHRYIPLVRVECTVVAGSMCW